MPDRTITTGGKERLPQATALLSQVFDTDPVITYLLHTMSYGGPSAASSSPSYGDDDDDGRKAGVTHTTRTTSSTTTTKNSSSSSSPDVTVTAAAKQQQQRTAYLPTYFHALLKAAGLNGASFDFISSDSIAAGDGGGCCGVLLPPGKRVDNFWTLLPAGFAGVLWKVGVRGCMRMLTEFTTLTDAAKAKALHDKKNFFYVFFLGTHPSARGQGLCSALVREYQKRAAAHGRSLWLEATTAYSMRLYARLGFRVVEEIVLGRGKVGPDGLACKGGEGVMIWGMVWDAQAVEEG